MVVRVTHKVDTDPAFVLLEFVGTGTDDDVLHRSFLQDMPGQHHHPATGQIGNQRRRLSLEKKAHGMRIDDNDRLDRVKQIGANRNSPFGRIADHVEGVFHIFRSEGLAVVKLDPAP